MMKYVSNLFLPSLTCGCMMIGAAVLSADQPAAPAPESQAESPEATETENGEGKEAGKLVPLNREETVLIDAEGKRILVKSEVVLREGLLEMLACRTQTKEHESILSIDARIYVIHTGLVALGAEPGSPVQFHPEFKPPSGRKIDIYLQWTDEKGKLHRVPGRNWIRHAVHRFYAEPFDKLPADLTIPEDSDLQYDEKNRELTWYGPMSDDQRDELLSLSADEKYRKAIASFYQQTRPRQMEADWVFAGSSFHVDENTGERHYQAEGGDVICVANFPSAMIDVAKESTASGEENLLFEAYTERIPPVGTEVTIELIPALEKETPEEQ